MLVDRWLMQGIYPNARTIVDESVTYAKVGRVVDSVDIDRAIHPLVTDPQRSFFVGLRGTICEYRLARRGVLAASKGVRDLTRPLDIKH